MHNAVQLLTFAAFPPLGLFLRYVGPGVLFLCESIDFVRSYDPNDMVGPIGWGDGQWIEATQVCTYSVRFENDPTLATAPAQSVKVAQVLDSGLNLSSFRLNNFAIGGAVFEVPNNRSSYTTRLDMVDSLGVLVDVIAGYDPIRQEVFWRFQSIDPATGLPPTSPLVGFLPINDSLNHAGEGFVSYSILPRAGVVSGDTMFAQASIIFDQNEPIETPLIFNTIDAGAPTSSMNTLPFATDVATFLLSWYGQDDSLGCGVRDYDIYMAVDTGQLEIYAEDVDFTSVMFSGEYGHTYHFYSIARDHVGHEEAPKVEAEATISIVQADPSVAVDDLTIRIEGTVQQPIVALRWSPVLSDTLGNDFVPGGYFVYFSDSLSGDFRAIASVRDTVVLLDLPYLQDEARNTGFYFVRAFPLLQGLPPLSITGRGRERENGNVGNSR